MKFRLFIDRDREEEVIVYAHEKSRLVSSIEKLVSDNTELIGYNGKTAVRINLWEVYCFVTERNKVYAITEKEKLQLKLRLYQLEEIADENFVKINQSCIANIRKIEKVQATFSASLSVVFRNGYTDYISRRNLKHVKERLGVKL